MSAENLKLGESIVGLAADILIILLNFISYLV